MTHRNHRRLNQEEEFIAFEKQKKKHQHNPGKPSDLIQREYQEQRQKGFSCLECRFPVSVEREISGVKNRNHCPRCLYSRHVDEFKAGDRKSDCRSRMEPIGLTLKHSPKRYGGSLQGELMLIHRCKGCGKISINRIAADDDAAKLYRLFEQSAHVQADWKERLEAQGIHVLGLADLTAVYSRLFGWQSILEEFETPLEIVENELPLPQKADPFEF